MKLFQNYFNIFYFTCNHGIARVQGLLMTVEIICSTLCSKSALSHVKIITTYMLMHPTETVIVMSQKSLNNVKIFTDRITNLWSSTRIVHFHYLAKTERKQGIITYPLMEWTCHYALISFGFHVDCGIQMIFN